jgi:hypothetical protein
MESLRYLKPGSDKENKCWQWKPDTSDDLPCHDIDECSDEGNMISQIQIAYQQSKSFDSL